MQSALQIQHKKKLAGVVGIGFLINNMANYDPTHTTVLRNRFVSDMRRRFRELRGAIRKAIVEQDVLGLARPETYALDIPAQKAFDFRLSSEKIDGFMGWLKTQENKGVLEIIESTQVGGAIKEPWTNKYIQSAYKKGLQRSRAELRKAGYPVPPATDEVFGGINAIFQGPVHTDAASILYSRTYNELKGITNAMDQQISRVLSQGIIDGSGPATMAREINNVIKKQGGTLATKYMRAEQRAVILARTEVIRAHNEASLQEFANWEVEGVKTLVEHVGAWDSRMCQQCKDIAGMDFGNGPGIFTRSQWRNYFPVHPQCLINGDDLIKVPSMWRAIKNIEVGDLVMTHKGRYKRVQQIHHTLDQLPDVVSFSFEEVTSLSVTGNHLIRVGVNGDEWKRADQIQERDFVTCLIDGILNFRVVRWVNKWKVLKPRTLYNLTVEDDESYIANSVVVHNCRCTPVPMDVTPKKKEKKVEEAILDKPSKTLHKQAYTDWQAKLKELNTPGVPFERWDALARETQQAKNKYISLLPAKEYAKERMTLLNQICQVEGKGKLSKGMMKKVKDGTDYIPHDVLDALNKRKIRVHVTEGVTRCTYNEGASVIKIGTKTKPRIIGHEFSHAIDDVVFGRKDGCGLKWTDNAFVTKKEGKRVQSWFKKNHFGKQGTYANGDGSYFKNNWINNYEGRIYSGTGVGDEWWAMNCERYSEFRFQLTRYDNEVVKLAREVEKQREKGSASYNVFKKHLNTMKREGADVWASAESGWDKVRKRHPQLSELIEDKFGQRICSRI